MREFLGHLLIICGCCVPGIVDYNDLVGSIKDPHMKSDGDGFGIVTSSMLLVSYSIVGGMSLLSPMRQINDEAESES